MIKNNICVGLDLDPNSELKEYYRIIDKTKELSTFYKINPAFFLNNYKKIQKVSDYIKFHNKKWIYDGKLGDVPHTNEFYAKFLYETLSCDGATLNPYLGLESLLPFFKYNNKINFLLCRTTNFGSEYIQDSIYKKVYNIANKLNSGLVIAGNKEGYLLEALESCPNSLILSPGIGSQGGEISIKSDRVIYNISRSIINSLNPNSELKKYVL